MAAYQDVVRLEVEMNIEVLVQRFEPFDQLEAYLDHRLEGKPFFFLFSHQRLKIWA